LWLTVFGVESATAISQAESSAPPQPLARDRDARVIALLASCVSVIATLLYWRRGDILLYGDAVAHIGIARRIVDSITPGLGQLGTVWLPMPHLLMIPFVAPLSWWRAGVAASIPSMAAYVFATLGIFSLFRDVASGERLHPHLDPRLVRAGAWLAAFAFAANPNLVYLQSTAMTEPLSLALNLWALVWLARFVTDPVGPRSRGALLRCGALLCAAEWTRYDGWFAAAWFVPIATVVWFRSWRRERPRALSMPGFTLFLVLVASGPMFWFWWNYANTRNPLDFANGPYSARGIEQRVKNKVDARAHPGEGDLPPAAALYVHAVQANFGEKRWGPTLFWAAVAGTLIMLLRAWGSPGNRRMLIWLLLWLPLPFYANSIAYGSVPIFTPFRWPFSYYNVRYGLQLLPCVALFGAALATFVAGRMPSRRAEALVFALGAVFGTAAYVSCFWQQPNRPKSLLPNEPGLGPIVWREAVINAATRVRYETQLANALSTLPANAKILMYTSDHIGAVQRAGIALRHVINEANYYEWRLALVTPGASADYVVASAGDAVSSAVAADSEDLQPIATIDVPGQPRTVVYRAVHPAAAAPHDMEHMH
jgi:hypothetical protein